MKVMKAWLSIHFLLFLLAPLTLNAEPTSSTFAIEKSPEKSWTQVTPYSADFALEAEEKIEESNEDSSPLSFTLASYKTNSLKSYLNVFFLIATSLWNAILQFCSRFTISPPLS